jgi:protein TonB
MGQLVVQPNVSDYGAREIKDLIRKYTWRAFWLTNSIFIGLFLALYLYNEYSNSASYAPPLAPLALGITELTDLNEPPPQEDMAAPPPPPPQVMIQGGPPQRAGTPIPIPDAEIAPDLKEFASMDVMSRASAEGGDGIDLGGFSDKIKFADKDLDVKVREQELPSPDDFIPVEKQPGVDIGKLQKLVEYPDLARRSGVEGRVIVKVLVDKTGEIIKRKIEYSDSQLLDQAALDAINKYGRFTPAIQNKEPVACWLSVPITFKLR